MNTATPHRFRLHRWLLLFPALIAASSLFAFISPAYAQWVSNDNSGRVLKNPAIYNIYLSDSGLWDADNPDSLSEANIDAYTQTLVNSDYLAKASQYGVESASFLGSGDTNKMIALPAPIVDGYTDMLSLTAWIAAALAPVDPTGTGIIRQTVNNYPPPDGNTLYVIYLAQGVRIWDVRSTCDGYKAVHSFASTLVWKQHWGLYVCIGCFCGPWPDSNLCCVACGPGYLPPTLEDQVFPFAVIPAECASGWNNPLDGIGYMTTHEIVEAATDPIVPTGWADRTYIGHGDDLLTKGEISDICSSVGKAPTGPVKMASGITVAPYWSNSDLACYPRSPSITLSQVGIPDAVKPVVAFDSTTQPLPYTTTVDVGSTHKYSFPTPVSDPTPGIQYVTSEPDASVVIDSDFSEKATYSRQYLLTTQAAPTGAASLVTAITPSTWFDVSPYFGMAFSEFTTMPLLSAGPDSQYRFDHWSSSTGAQSLTLKTDWGMTGPLTVTANYVLQHQITIKTSGLGFNPTHVYNGSTLLGLATDWSPLVVFVDDGPLALSVDTTVQPPGVTYFFKGFAPTPPTNVTAAFSATASYDTPFTCTPHCGPGWVCASNSDCGSNVCTGNTCQPPACSPNCGPGFACGTNSDCSSGVCTNNQCAPAWCAPNCGNGSGCGASSDCLSRNCATGICQPDPCSPNCGPNAACGASDECASRVCPNGLCAAPACSPSCSDGAACGASTDCLSRNCVNGTCQPAACSPSCGPGAACGAGPECSSRICANGLCGPPTCSPSCSDGATCGASMDCLSRNCLNGKCQPATCSPNCGPGAACGAGPECGSRVCMSGLCRPPACSPSCGNGTACGANTDCSSHICTNGTCRAAPPCSPHCGPSASCSTNADCSSTVCGSRYTCSPPGCSPYCNQGAACGAAGDCSSQVCTSGVCQAPACSPRCTQSATCGNNGDCLSSVCGSNHTCSPPGCSPNCNQGAQCGAAGDCASRVCASGLCQPPTCSPRCARSSRCANNNDCTSHSCLNGLCQ